MLTIQGKQYITISEASKLTGYHPDHIQKLATENKIEATKIVCTWAISQESIVQYKQSEKGHKRLSKAQKVDGLKMYQKAFGLGHKMRKSPDGRVYCIHCQETIKNISKENLSCKKQ